MPTWRRIIGLTLATAGLLLGGAAASADPARAPSVPASPGTLVPSRPALHESTYVPTTPCRVADTRAGAALYGLPFDPGEQRSYQVTGASGIGDQGGRPGGCGIPGGAVAVSAVVTAVSPKHAGFLRAWPYADYDNEPTATLLNYATSSIGTGTTLQLAQDQSFELSVKTYGGRTDVVIDVVGYYEVPMAALVEPGGKFHDGSRVVSSVRVGEGSYRVVFDRNVTGCTISATSGQQNRFISALNFTGDLASVEVHIATRDGTPISEFFYLVVTC